MLDEPRSKKMVLYMRFYPICWGVSGGRYYKDHKYDSFAHCLAKKEAKMYGLYWCPHCADKKRCSGGLPQRSVR